MDAVMGPLLYFSLEEVDWEHVVDTRADLPSSNAPLDDGLSLPTQRNHSCGDDDSSSPRHSRVHAVVWRKTRQCVAQKVVSLPPEEPLREIFEQRAARVARVMAAPAHIPLARYLAAHVDDDRHYAWLMDHYTGGSLRTLLYDPPTTSSPPGCSGGLDDRLCATIAAQILEALGFLHTEAHVFHGDVSLSNVLLAAPYSPQAGHDRARVRLADLDDACDLDAVLPQPTGALFYRPPEWWGPPDLTTEESDATPVWTASAAVDVWSFGVLLTQLLTGKCHPCLPKIDLFSTEAESSLWLLFDNLGTARPPTTQTPKPPRSDGDWLDLTALHVSEAARAVLRRCFEWNPAERATADELLRMPWFGVR